MLKDKNGNNVSLEHVLSFLTGTDEIDEAKSVIDFSLYTIIEDNKVGNPEFYIVASEAIVTQISFIGPFVMVELDFRNLGTSHLENIMAVINRFHDEINTEKKLFLSTITSLEKEATHILSLINPLICVRGFSSEGNASTLLQLIYSADNVGFSIYDIDYDEINADIEREIQELESMAISNEIMEAAMEAEMEDENNEEMTSMFKPEFGFRTPESKLQDNINDVRVSGSRASVKVDRKTSDRIKSSDTSKVQSVKDSNDDD